MSTKSNEDCCGGCGETDGNKRCIGCMHPFSTTPTPTARTDELALDAAGEILQAWDSPTLVGCQLKAHVQCIVQRAIEAGQQRQPREALTDERIGDIANSMPGGLDGFCKGWGWQSFARAIEAEINNATT